MKTVILDLNRTLYDPDNDLLLPRCASVLATLKERGYDLHLLSRNEGGGERLALLARFGIEHFFSSLHFVEEKTAEVFQSIIRELGLQPKQVYVVGDYLHEDIRFGNQCGAWTIWLKQGTFESLLPEIDSDAPWKTVRELKELLEVID